MYRLVNLARFPFVHGENVHKILYIGIVQSFQIRKAGFH